MAVSGEQKFYDDRIVNEDDFKHGHVQYAMHKIFNEWQAQDYREKHGMEITTIRPANVTGPDKVVGSVDHVFCITNPARGKPVKFPYKDTMRAPIHVDEIAEIFARVVTKDKPDHAIYNTGGHTISLGDLADLVREFLPDAQITFDNETGGRETVGQLSDRQQPGGAGIRHAVPPLPRTRPADHQRSPCRGRQAADQRSVEAESHPVVTLRPLAHRIHDGADLGWRK